MSTENNPTTGFLGREFVFTREFATPREHVFKAWTDGNHLAQWWGPTGFTNPVCEWDLRPGGKIYDIMRAPDGAEHPMGGEFLEIVLPEQLIFSCGALDENGKLLFELLHHATFAEQNGKTTLTVRSKVTMTTSNADKYLGGFEQGMTLSLDRLDQHLAYATEPLVIERTLAAPAAAVWRAITDAREMKHWYFDLERFLPEAGFKFEFTVEHEGNRYCHQCQVTEVIPQKRLAYTWRYEGHPGDSLVSFDLFAQGNTTRLKLTHVGLESFPVMPQFDRKNFAAGWTQLIGTSLKEFAEAKS
jgi:uncharacterized protein YndB with AHSA1/START domain